MILRTFALPFVLGSVAILSAGCSSAAEAQTLAPQAENPVAVQTVVVAARPMPRWLTLTGSLEANRRSDLAADGSGKVIETFVERGSFVEKGKLIARLDARSAALSAQEALASSKAARAQAELARIERERSEKLLAKGAVSPAEVDRRRTEDDAQRMGASAAEARAALAGKSVGDSLLRAPFSGLVAERYVSMGEYVRADTAVVTLLEIDPIRLAISVPESSLAAVRADQSVEFGVSTYPGERFAGTVRHVGVSLGEKSRDLVVEAVAPNADHKLTPGMFATARVRLADQEMPAVPLTAIKKGGGTPRVFVVVDGRLQERLVQLGEADDRFVGVVSGLALGESVVDAPGDDARDGVKAR